MNAERSPDAWGWLLGGGEMGALVRNMDWSRTALGAVEDWSDSLRTAVSICMSSRYPMLIFWGSEYIQIYNDAYRPVLGATKHPAAMGKRGQETWNEIWNIIGPMLDSVFHAGQSTWSEDQLLPMNRYGYVEETYFTFSYSPIADGAGIGGILVVCTETTHRVLGERRLQTLRDLGARDSSIHTEAEAYCTIETTLAENPKSVPFALIYTLSADEQTARLAATVGTEPDIDVSPETISLADAQGWPLDMVKQTWQMCVVDLKGHFRHIPSGSWPEPPEKAVILPLFSPQQRLMGFLIMGINARRALDYDYYGFLELAASQVAATITTARAYDEELRRVEALAALDRAKTAFFNNVSHEFRTPLTLLLGPLKDLLASALTPEQRELGEIAHRSSLRLLKLVNTLLDFSRIEAGRIQAAYEPTDLATLTADLASAFRAAVERENMALIVDTPPLPEPVCVDPEMWEKIVLNLLSNAFKFTFEGQIEVALTATDQAAILTVRDTGVGIPAGELPHIFERFHRVRETRARTLEGTGIGLSLVQDLVHLHGGTITVESTEGQGTTFTVSLPFGRDHLPADQINAPRAQQSTTLGTAPFVEEILRWQPQSQPPESALADLPADPSLFRVLIADDNADMRDYLTRLLSPQYQVEAVSDGAQALTAIQKQRPDLLLADIMMPSVDGLEVVRRLRADPTTRLLPIVLLSARAGEEAAIEGLETGANDYLTKPFSAQHLLARIHTQLLLGQARRTLEELYQISQTLGAAHTPEQILDGVMSNHQFGEAALTGIYWYNRAWTTDTEPEHGIILASRSADPTHTDISGTRFDFGDYQLMSIAARDKAVTILDTTTDPRIGEKARETLQHFNSQSLITLPLIVQGVAWGYLYAHWDQPRAFDEYEIRHLQAIADQAAAALYTHMLFEAEAKARHSAEEASAMKTKFIGMVSHELRTPLTSIKGFATTLLAPDIEFSREDQREFIHIINTETDHLTGLIEQLLELTRMQTGTFQINAESVSLVELLASAKTHLDLLTAQHQLLVTVPPNLPPAYVDKTRIAQVLTNLVHNAAKFSPAGSPISISAKRESNRLVIDVADQGRGIPEDQRETVFETFLQLQGSEHSGTGLGLSISRGIVEAHGGRIWIRETGNQGTTVSFTLPIVPDSWKDRG